MTTVEGVIERQIKFPVWLDPVARGRARFRAALETAADAVADFVWDLPGSYPPIVIHLSGGPGCVTEADERDVETAAESLRNRANRNGSRALLFHVYLSDVSEPMTVFPADNSELGDDDAQLLFRTSK